MKLVVKSFEELSVDELFAIYKLRTDVFVVEQNCAYPEVDDADKVSYHIWLEDQDGMEAYARVLPAHVTFDTPSIGRVIAVKRHCGLGSEIVKDAIEVAKDKFHAQELTIEAQTYARRLYEKSGFRQTSEPFLDAGVEHIQMKMNIDEKKAAD